MNKKNIARRLLLVKQTVAHLNNEQMKAAHGGEEESIVTTKTGIDTKLICTNTDKATDAC